MRVVYDPCLTQHSVTAYFFRLHHKLSKPPTGCTICCAHGLPGVAGGAIIMLLSDRAVVRRSLTPTRLAGIGPQLVSLEPAPFQV